MSDFNAWDRTLIRILVVDDEPFNFSFVRRLLEAEGYSNIEYSEDGCEAIEKVKQSKFDVILLDIEMPKLDGYGVLRELKSDPDNCHIPVIMISALDNIESIASCIEMGADDYLPKPFNPTLLRARLNASIEKKRAHDQEVEHFKSDIARVSRWTMMGELTASIAHEIRQPLAAIVANGNAGMRWLAKPTPDLDEVRAALSRIIADGHRASEVIENVRAMFKKGSKDKARVDVNQLIRETLALVQSELRIRQVSVRTELTADHPVAIGDRIQLQQVILNLIMNALDAMTSVTGRARELWIGSERDASGGILISIKDSGTGIDPKDIDQIFDAFFTTKSHGMGIGLSVCRSIVEAHGGRLSGSPGHPHGSVFQVILPIPNHE